MAVQAKESLTCALCGSNTFHVTNEYFGNFPTPPYTYNTVVHCNECNTILLKVSR